MANVDATREGMTPETTARTPYPWVPMNLVRFPWRFLEKMDGGLWIDAGPALLFALDGPPEEIAEHPDIIAEARAAGELIVAAGNACHALNPSDPLAAAQHLEALVKAVERLIGWHHGYRLPEDGAIDLVAAGERRVDELVDALSRVTGKP